MRKLITISLLCLFSKSVQGQQKYSYPKTTPKKKTETVKKKNEHIPLKDALIEFNLKAKIGFDQNKYFATEVYQYFSYQGKGNMTIEGIQEMMESLLHNFENTDKVLKMFKERYQEREEITKGLMSINITATSSDELAKYALEKL